jgi:hypothetical protein
MFLLAAGHRVVAGRVDDVLVSKRGAPPLAPGLSRPRGVVRPWHETQVAKFPSLVRS